MRQRWKKRVQIALLAALLLLAACGVWAFLVEPDRLIVRQETIQIDSWPKELSGLRIAVISDIHTGAPFINDKS